MEVNEMTGESIFALCFLTFATIIPIFMGIWEELGLKEKVADSLVNFIEKRTGRQ